MEVGALYGCISCGWLGVVCAWQHATVGSRRGWLVVVLAQQADLSGRLGTMGHCALTVGRSSH